jgi:predicted amidohydrolase YtcJ
VGGEVELDEQGIPTGLLKERAVEPLLASFANLQTSEQRRVFLIEGLKQCLAHGLTCVQTNDEAAYDIYMSLLQDLPTRVLLTPQYREMKDVLAKCDNKYKRLDLSSNGSSVEAKFAIERVKVKFSQRMTRLKYFTDLCILFMQYAPDIF